MVDLSSTIIAKSDQLNAIDLISGSLTVLITKVERVKSPDQPVIIHYQGDNGRPWKPSKGMRVVLLSIWGKDGAKYVGKSLTIYCDESVKWAGQDVGGIRISHMSGIDNEKSVVVKTSRNSYKTYKIKPLVVHEDRSQSQRRELSPADEYARRLGHIIKNEPENAQKFWDETQDQREALQIPDERLLAMDEAVSKAIGS